MKDGNHIEYEIMLIYHVFRMEVKIISATMWDFQRHHQLPSERTHRLYNTKACTST